MDLIIDGGASNLSYVIFDQNQILLKEKLQGRNFMHGVEHIDLSGIKHRQEISRVFLFGAGIRAKDDNSALENLMLKTFPSASLIELHNDLDLTAIAIGNTPECIVSIIGTGSNAGLSQFGKLTKTIIAGGYVLGDQGSGYKIGKKILQYYIENRFSEQEDALFLSKFGTSKFDIVKAVYDADNTKRFVAKHSTFIHEISEDLRNEILRLEFHKFFQNVFKQIPESQQLKFNFSGSIAFHFADAIRMAGKEKGIVVDQIVASPMENIDAIYAFIKEQYG